MCGKTCDLTVSNEIRSTVDEISPRQQNSSADSHLATEKSRVNFARIIITLIVEFIYVCFSAISDPLCSRILGGNALLMELAQGFVLFSNSPLTSYARCPIAIESRDLRCGFGHVACLPKIELHLFLELMKSSANFSRVTRLHAADYSEIFRSQAHENQHSCRGRLGHAQLRASRLITRDFLVAPLQIVRCSNIHMNRLRSSGGVTHEPRTCDVVNENQQRSSVGENRWSSRVDRTQSVVGKENSFKF
jgi:hypothetical protein